METKFMQLPDSLLTAYRETHYHVHSDPPFILHPGTYSEPLDRLHHIHGVTSSAFITAWNPYSESLSRAQNDEHQQKLRDEIEHKGWVAIAGIGQHPSNSWPGEESFLIPGVDQCDAEDLGKRYGQNAVVFSNSSAIPVLLVLARH